MHPCLSFLRNSEGAYCHRVSIENYHAWRISNQSSIRACEDDSAMLRANYASTGAKRHVLSFEFPQKLVLQCGVSFQCSHDGNVATAARSMLTSGFPSSIPCDDPRRHHSCYNRRFLCHCRIASRHGSECSSIRYHRFQVGRRIDCNMR